MKWKYRSTVVFGTLGFVYIALVNGNQMPVSQSSRPSATDLSNLAQYNVQRIRPDQLHKVTVSLRSISDTTYLYINSSDSSENLVVKIELILKTEIKQRTVDYSTSNAGIIFSIGGPKTPKVYELSLEVRDPLNKKFTYRFVSDSVVCQRNVPCREGTDSGQSVRDLADAIHRAIDNRNASLKRAADEEAKQRAQPSSLLTTVRFDDSQSFLPDSRLDAGKKAELVISVENHGPGTAYQVVTTATSNQHSVYVNGGQNLGDIPPGQKKETRLPISGGLDMTDGEVTVTVDTREQQRNYAARRISITIPTTSLNPPHLSIESHWLINDGTTGFAQGNGNGRPENGEKFELLISVRNDGPGPAMGVVLAATHLPPHIEPVHASEEIGLIQPGEIKQGKLAFGIPRDWSGVSLDIQVKARDARGEGVALASQDISLKVGVLKPALTASMRVLSNGLEDTELANGQVAVLEITPRNDGEIEAEDVVLQVSAPGVTFEPSQIDLGNIPPHGKQNARRIQFSLPRSFATDRLPVVVELSQKDFPVAPVNQQFPVSRHRPELQRIWTVLDAPDSRAIEQNQTATLDLVIDNNGSLAAQDVVATIHIQDSGIKPLSPLEVKLGTIAVKERRQVQFSLLVGRSVPVGQLPVQVSISQIYFPTLIEAVPLEVRAEQEIAVRVTPTPSARTFPVHNSPPTVVWAHPADGSHAHDATLQVVGVVSSDNPIRDVRVEVNGIPLPDELVRQHWNRPNTAQGPEVSTITISIPLEFGGNKLQLTAVGQNEQRGTAAITVIRDNTASMKEIETQRLEVVLLRRKQTTGKSGETAAGIYVGKDQTYAYFATAFHFVQLQSETIELFESVQLQFSRGAPVEGRIFERYLLPEEGDLAVVYIPVSQLPPDIPPMIVKDAKSGLDVRIVGHPAADQGWALWEGKVQDEIAVKGKNQFFSSSDNLSLAKGFSGGPIFDPFGNLIGMHLASSDNHSFATNLKSAALLDTLKAWHIPITNLER
jgi:hypothetical protein